MVSPFTSIRPSITNVVLLSVRVFKNMAAPKYAMAHADVGSRGEQRLRLKKASISPFSGLSDRNRLGGDLLMSNQVRGKVSLWYDGDHARGEKSQEKRVTTPRDRVPPYVTRRAGGIGNTYRQRCLVAH
jgi:hypothetical protein